jgi:hypothetical protein
VPIRIAARGGPEKNDPFGMVRLERIHDFFYARARLRFHGSLLILLCQFNLGQN